MKNNKRFREEIYAGSYNRESKTSMSEYMLNLSKQAKYLNPLMSEHEVIRCVKRHFGRSIAREIRPTTIKNIEKFVTLLDEIEYERERTRKVINANSETKFNKTFIERKKADVECTKFINTENYAQRGAAVATSQRACQVKSPIMGIRARQRQRAPNKDAMRYTITATIRTQM